MNKPMTRNKPQQLGTFNNIRVFDCRNTISIEGMSDGDMYIAQVLLSGELYAMRLRGRQIWGIASDNEALQAFNEARQVMQAVTK